MSLQKSGFMDISQPWDCSGLGKAAPQGVQRCCAATPSS